MLPADTFSITPPLGTGLVTSRRNFFTRAFGLTVAGTTVAVPVLTITTPAERIRHHAAALEAALRDAYPDAKILAAEGPLGGCREVPTIGCWVFSVDVGRQA